MLRILLLLSCLTVVAVSSFEDCVTVSGSKANVRCVFPFKFQDQTFTTCILETANDGKAWCSTSTDRYGNHLQGNWGHCASNCPVGNSNSGRRWIQELLNKHGNALKLKHLTLPGTHHSGLVESLSPFNIIMATGITQTLTPTQQFESGVRVFDLRFCGGNKNYEINICHKVVNGMKWKDFLQDSINFLNKNPSEFFVFVLQWEMGFERWDDVAETLNHPCVYPFIYNHIGDTDIIMRTPICNLQGKILINTDINETGIGKLKAAGIPTHFPNNRYESSWYKGTKSNIDELLERELRKYTNDRISIYDDKMYDVDAYCTPIIPRSVKELDEDCKPKIESYLNTEDLAKKANVISLDFASTSLVRKIYRLNMNKNIPTGSGTCTLMNPVSSCSVKETCDCKYDRSRDGCVVSHAPNVENSACKCNVVKTYTPPSEEQGVRGTYDIFCEGAPVYVKQNAPKKGDTSLEACEAGCGNCDGYEICDCHKPGLFKGCTVYKQPPEGYSSCDCSFNYNIWECNGISKRLNKHPNC